MMKKLKLLLLLAIPVALMSSCKTNDVTPGSPITVTVTPSTVNAAPGDSLTFAVSITDNNNLKDVVVNASVGGGTASQIASLQLSGKSWSYNQGYKVPKGFTGNIVLTFTVDDANNTQTATATITVASNATAINAWSQVLVGNYNDASAGSFYASATNTVYTLSSSSANQAAIDMIFFFGTTNQATLAAPSDGSFGTGAGQISSLNVQTWGTKNATQFKKTSLSASDFNGITDGTVLATDFNNVTSSADTKANTLASGNVVAFKTVTGKFGLALIGSITNTNASTGTGTMQVTVKVQK